MGEILGGLASGLVGSLFGGSSSSGQPSAQQQSGLPQKFGFGGLAGNAVFTKKKLQSFNLAPTEERMALIRSAQSIFNQQGDDFGGLLSKVIPGFGALTTARVQAIRDAGLKTTGDLRDTLARRRVLGSSFGNDALVRAQMEVGKQESEARAQSFLEELGVTTQLIDKQATARQSAVQIALSNMDFVANAGVQLLSQVSTNLSTNAQVQANLAAEAAKGAGAFWQPTIDAIGTGVTDWANNSSWLQGLFS